MVGPSTSHLKRHEDNIDIYQLKYKMIKYNMALSLLLKESHGSLFWAYRALYYFNAYMGFYP